MELIVAGAIVLLSIFPGSTQKIQEALPLSPSPSPQVLQIPISTPTPTGPKMHTVKNGETMTIIADKYYGGSKYWTLLWNDNDFVSDPRKIKAGMEFKIRNDKPTDTEELKVELAKIYKEIIKPTPTITPTHSLVVEAQTLPAGSFDQVYKDAGSKFGVPWEILYGLHLIETGLRDGAISSGRGPQGPLQFMPGTWAVYGIDGNGDGVADINNAIDAIHGAANYIARHGSVEAGLRSYGQVYDKVMSAARQRGYGG